MGDLRVSSRVPSMQVARFIDSCRLFFPQHPRGHDLRGGGGGGGGRGGEGFLPYKTKQF